MNQVSNDWNPEIPGQAVRLKANPGLRGHTTGKVRKAGSRTLVEVQFGPAEKSYKPKNLLECCGDDESIEAMMGQGRYGGPDDLRRILTFEKLKGKLTNIFYSMESSQTQFYAHQFKPILKFVNSAVGRLLIADEVGLGKTIEAIYIWKEIQVREDAQRLLIICPAMLREKWQDDLRQRFNIFADIVDARGLLQHVRLSLERPRRYSFVCIASLEGIRPGKNWENPNNHNPRAQLAQLLDSHAASQEQSVFNLAIIDEAHYLRNASTASHRIGQLVRDASQHLLLLTATPVQVDSANLYQLLRLISPEDFPSEDLFNKLLEANQPIIEALRYLWSTPANFLKAKECVEQAKRSQFFADNRLLDQITSSLTDRIEESDDQRIELGFHLEKASLLNQYITRSRKRDVLPDRVERKPQTLQVHFSALEKQIYDVVTSKIRQQLKGKRGASLFQLIARQRQMASCMVAALETWKRDRILGQFLDESCWEDFGLLTMEKNQKLSSLAELDSALSTFDLETLEEQDSKYQKLKFFLENEINKNSQEKFVIFAYFRGTLQYLERRLQRDQISTCLIMGDMGDRKWDTIQQFRQKNGPSVLLSSEVGSEGIDLQHCRFLVNYDLPWNPMRVEQRIGRLDRLGQKAKSISIINFSLVDTIEEKILERLYERIQVFEESIGDLESILGDMTEQLIAEFFNTDLSPGEREKRAIQTGDALIKQRVLQNELENEAVNMMAFSDHILDSINQSRDEGRWLQPREINRFIEDYFARYYPGTIITQPSDLSKLYQIKLSEKAKTDLQFFISQNNSATPTRLHTASVSVGCFFDPKIAKNMGKNHELIDPNHPLIRWIRDRYSASAQTLHPVSAISISSSIVSLDPGEYVYSIYLWDFEGVKAENRLVYKVISVDNGIFLSDQHSESLVSVIMQQGQTRLNAHNFINNVDLVIQRQTQCNQYIETAFDQAIEYFIIDNENHCNVQEKSARTFAERKQLELRHRLERFHREGKTQIIPAIEGQLNKVNRELEVKLKVVDQKRSQISFNQQKLASGIIFVTH